MIYAAGVGRAFGKAAGIWYVVLQASQFHLMYYASRTLPNTFSFGLSMLSPFQIIMIWLLIFPIPGTLALRYLLPDTTSLTKVKRTRLAIYLLAISAVIFRAELALLLVSHCAYMLVKVPNNELRGSLIRTVILPAGLSGTIAGVVLTVSIDTFFWQSSTPLWPELSAFLSNIFPSGDSLGASAWGTSPWHWYFSSALPRLFMNPLVIWMIFLSLIPVSTRASALDLIIPNVIYVAIYSFLPHKETRFVFPVIPPLTTAAALAASNFTITSHRLWRSRLVLVLLVLSTILSFILSHLFLLPLSSLNYPGAVALQSLHSYAGSPTSPTYRQRQISVHLDNLACQTGVTRFLQVASGGTDQSPTSRWVYDKSDNTTEQLSPEFWQRFDYVIAETPGRVIGAWDIVESVYALNSRPRLLRPDHDRGLRILGDKKAEGNKLYGKYGYGYGENVLWIWDVANDLLREGYLPGMANHQGRSWTGGWWAEPSMVERLYILQRGRTGIGVEG